MSAAVQGALVGGALALAATIANLAFNYFTRREERQQDYREWYRRAFFEKRIKALQEAYAWLMSFYRARNSTTSDPQWSPQLIQLCSEAREWYQDNALFLHGSLPKSSEFVGAISWLQSWAAGDERAGGEVSQALLRAEKEVRDRLQEVHWKDLE